MSASKIYEYIQSKKYGPARNLLNEEFAKTPDSCVYKSLHALLLFQQNFRSQAIETVESVVASKQVNSTIVINLLAPILLGYDMPELLNSAFEQANRRAPHDKQLVAAWIESALSLGNLKLFCKALLANNKQQQTRKSAFQTCFALYLVFESVTKLDIEYKLYPNLAARMLEPHLPVQSQNEFYTLVKVTSMQSKISELLKDHLEFAQDLTVQQSFLSDLAAQEDWGTLFDYSKRILDRIDTYNCWQALNTAAVHLDRVDEVKKYVATFKSNNSYLALVDLAEKRGEDVLEQLEIYWAKMQHRPCAYEYLKDYSQISGFSRLLLQEPATFTAKVNRIKLQYLLDDASADVAALIELYQNHLNELPAESTDYFIGSDLLIIGALQLLKQSKHVEALLLLEYASSNDTSNFYVRLWLMKLYHYFGCISLVQHQYKRLSIKNLQHESLGHYLAFRAGTLGLAPKQFTETKKMYEQSENMYSATNVALDDQVFCQISSMLELQRRMNCSLTRSLLNLEQLKSQRINRGETDMSHVINTPEGLIDNRDSTTFFDPRGEASSLGFGNFDKAYIANQLARERLFLAILRDEPSSLVEIDTSTFSAAEKWSVDCLRSQEALPLPSTADLFTWEVLHNISTAIETYKLLTDISLKKKCKVDLRSRHNELREVLKNAVNSRQDHAKPLQWAVEYCIAGAESVIAGIVESRSKALNDLASLIK